MIPLQFQHVTEGGFNATIYTTIKGTNNLNLLYRIIRRLRPSNYKTLVSLAPGFFYGSKLIKLVTKELNYANLYRT